MRRVGNPEQSNLKKLIEELGHEVRIIHNQFWIDGKLIGTKQQAWWFIENLKQRKKEV